MLYCFDAVRHSAGLEVKRGWQQVRVAVASGDAQRRSGSDDARADYVAVVDGVTQRDVRVIVSTDVAHGSKTRFQRAPRVSRTMQGFARGRDPEP